MQSLKKIVKPLVPHWVIKRRSQRRHHQCANAAGLKLVERDLFFDLERGERVLRIRSSHDFYLPHVIENFDYYMDSVVPLRTEGKMLVDMSGPRYHVLQGFTEMPFLFPSHTEPYNTTAEYLDFADLREGQVVLDIGAYSGVTSIIFAGLVGATGRVFAFEADRTNYECAVQNVRLAERWMGLNNISLIHKAIWSHNDGVLFSHEGAMGSSAVEITGGHRAIEAKTPSTTIESFLEEYQLTHVDFIKVDIEGGEIEMLQNSVRILSQIKPKLIVEPHFVGGSMSTEPCCRLLKDAGYSVRVRDQVGESEPLIEAVAKK